MLRIGTFSSLRRRVNYKILCEVIRNEVRYNGQIIWNRNMPNETLHKLLDSRMFMSFGWKPCVRINEGVKLTYQ